MMGLFIKSAVVLMLVYSVFGSPTPASKKKFRIFLEEKSWHESLLHCFSHNMTLATIVSQQEQDQVEKLVNQTFSASGYRRNWLGGADILLNNNFTWFSTGEPFVYKHFRGDQPDHRRFDDGVVEHCLELNVGEVIKNYNWNYQWNDARCEHRHSFICHYFE